MGKSHSKSGKAPSFVINDRAPLSPRQKRGKSDRKKLQKNGFLKKTSKLDSLKTPQAPLIDHSEMLNEDDFEVEIKRHMQDQLAFNSDIFVLNQMMMSVQFFANYERFVDKPNPDCLQCPSIFRKSSITLLEISSSTCTFAILFTLTTSFIVFLCYRVSNTLFSVSLSKSECRVHGSENGH
jgi:hypothetical protein